VEPIEPTEPATPPVEPPSDREPPRFTPSLGAVGGLFVVGGALGLIGELVDDDGDGARILAGVLALAVAAAALFARTLPRLEPSIATALVAVAAIAAGAGVMLVLVDPSSVDGLSSFTAPLLFAAIVWLVLFFAGPVKGRPFVLGLALVAVWFGALTVVDPFDATSSTDVFSEIGEPVEDDPTIGGFDDEFTFDEEFEFEEEPPVIELFPFGFDVEGAAGDVGAVSLLFGVGYLIASAAFDRRRRGDVSTPFVAVGIPAAALGLIGVSADIGSVPGALFTLLVAGAVCWMGAAYGRRLSTWAGAAGVAVALGALADKIDGDNNSVASSLVAIVFGVGLTALAATALRRVDAP
jgi:hypothetical protein